jgi:hypothetical protein
MIYGAALAGLPETVRSAGVERRAARLIPSRPTVTVLLSRKAAAWRNAVMSAARLT